ncbi:MAG: hypothetical protein E7111_05815 [Bacteroidales bacterium]|nr:hypothetical protein [Bacteroidales bacterium]
MSTNNFLTFCLFAMLGVACTPSGGDEDFSSGAAEAFTIPFSVNGSNVAPPGKYSLVNFRITDADDVVSLKLQASHSLIAGKAYYFPKLDEYALSDGQTFIVCNLTEPRTAGPVNVTLSVCPGDYSGELEVIMCDKDHRVSRQPVALTVLEPGRSYDVDLAFTPDESVMFYEGFDLCVWGGDYPSGPGSDGYVPEKENSDTEADVELTGYEMPSRRVEYNVAGSGYIQAGSWDEVSNSTLADFHAVSDLYLTSRNFTEFGSLWRCQEYQGCLGVGVSGASRGVFQTSPFVKIGDGVSDVKFNFDMCLMSSFDDDFSIRVSNGGVIRSVTYNGRELELTGANPSYVSSYSEYTIPRAVLNENLGRSSSVSVHISNAGSATSVRLASLTNTSGSKGFFLDNITLVRAEPLVRPQKSLRVLYWNIQYGMWGDQGNNYDNFVKWVKAYNPDVCVWCETASVHKTGSSEYLTAEDPRYLRIDLNNTAPFLDAWKALAGRYGHQYVSSGALRDNYPQIISSKYPIETLKQIGVPSGQTNPVVHGSGLYRINVHGEKINIVSVHLYPQKYTYGLVDTNGNGLADEQEASARLREGDVYREWEMKQIIAETVNNSAYAADKNWIFCGDFNSRSWMDKWYYESQNVVIDDSEYLVHDAIRNQTRLKDLIGNWFYGQFVTSNARVKRPDYIYMSSSMYAKVYDAYVVMDGWCSPKEAIYDEEGNVLLYSPADHRPVLVDLDMDKTLSDESESGIEDLNPRPVK